MTGPNGQEDNPSLTLPALEGKGGILGVSIKNKPNGAHDSSFV